MALIGIIRFMEELAARGERGYRVFIHGGHPTVLPERTLRESGADFVVVGEGYDSIVRLHQHVTGAPT
jgi:radical SAM superfamily enzyme YgiQ (UPF0313 family)